MNQFFKASVLMLAPTVFAQAAPLKVDLNPPDRRGDVLTAGWENWGWETGRSGSRTFGNVTVTFKTASSNGIAAVLNKGLLDFGVHTGCDGIAVPSRQAEEIEMVISGLETGRHSLVTYHNEVRDWAPATLDVVVGTERLGKGLQSTARATNDYELASSYVEFEAPPGSDVVVRFRADERAVSNRSVVINGFEIDAVNPRLKAIKPAPTDGDEHVAEGTTLSWTAGEAVVAHELYMGRDSNAVQRASTSSAEFKGRLTTPRHALPQLHHRDTWYWRVDQVRAGNAAPIKGDVWRLRTRFLAFPSAEGYGRFALGGRGGRVIEVTTLEDYDSSKGEAVIPGSYRAAVEAEGPRTVVFRVSGLIRLKRPCAVSKPYCTIAGQTAPGDGICLANYSAGAFGSHDVIIRFMRFRIGDVARKAMDGAGLGSCDHSIMDHCSISWSSDEGTISRNARNITFQRNIVSEALHHSYHYRASDRTKFETHAFAGSISGNIGSYHHNLLAHCTDRNWSLAGGYNQAGNYTGYLDIRNNVVYNWTARTSDGGVAQLNYVNNYYKPNPKNRFVNWLLKLDPIDPARGKVQYFMSGNVMEGFDYEADNWKAFYNGASVQKLVRVDQPLFEPFVRTQSAREAFTNVLADVGASFPKQDVIDRRIIEEARAGTTHYTGTKGPAYGDRPGPNFAGIIDEPTDNKDAAGSPNFPWPEYRTYNVPADSDHDGMPDDWEKRTGLNANDSVDGNGDRDGDGYTNLEEYLGWLVGEFTAPESGRVKTE